MDFFSGRGKGLAAKVIEVLLEITEPWKTPLRTVFALMTQSLKVLWPVYRSYSCLASGREDRPVKRTIVFGLF